MTPELALAEPIPRHPSFVFAPADPRLIGFARNWSIAEPYVIQAQEDQTDDASSSLGRHNGPSLPLEAINDGAEGLIRLKTPQLPPFLQR